MQTDHRPRPIDALVWHEAAHAVIGHRLGFRIEFIDMTGLYIASPVCGMDVEPVPAYERARARGIAALAGPIGESFATNRTPMWRQDGAVAKVSAKALATGESEQAQLMIQWTQEARAMLNADTHYKKLVQVLAKNEMMTGREVIRVLKSNV